MAILADSTPDAAMAYAALAPAYDVLTDDYDHERWLEELERLAVGHGLRGRRVLDVACGTGKSFAPLLSRGYDVTACDLSAEMLVHAARYAASTRLFRADMRRLEVVGSFDLVTCLDDALNYLLTEEDLRSTFQGFAANLSEDGLALFDINTLLTFRTAFAASSVTERDGFFVVWEGRTAPDIAPGEMAEAIVHVFSADAKLWERRTSVHRQRHWSPQQVSAIAEGAGLEVIALYGQRTGALIQPVLDEAEHTKAVFVARRPAAPARRG